MSTKNLKIIAITLIMLLSAGATAPAAKSQQQESVPSYEPVAGADIHLTAASDAMQLRKNHRLSPNAISFCRFT